MRPDQAACYIASLYLEEAINRKKRAVQRGLTEQKLPLDEFVADICRQKGVPQGFYPVFIEGTRRKLEELARTRRANEQASTFPADPRFEIPGEHHVSMTLARQLLGAFDLCVVRGSGKRSVTEIFEIVDVYPYDTVGKRCIKSFDGVGVNENGARKIRLRGQWYVWSDRGNPIVTVVADTSRLGSSAHAGYRPVVNVNMVRNALGRELKLKEALRDAGHDTDSLIRAVDGTTAVPDAASLQEDPVPMFLRKRDAARFVDLIRKIEPVKHRHPRTGKDDDAANSDGCFGRMSLSDALGDR